MPVGQNRTPPSARNRRGAEPSSTPRIDAIRATRKRAAERRGVCTEFTAGMLDWGSISSPRRRCRGEQTRGGGRRTRRATSPAAARLPGIPAVMALPQQRQAACEGQRSRHQSRKDPAGRCRPRQRPARARLGTAGPGCAARLALGKRGGSGPATERRRREPEQGPVRLSADGNVTV
jgi:hypothetical protein